MSDPMFYISNQLDYVTDVDSTKYLLVTESISSFSHVRFNFRTDNPDDSLLFSFYRVDTSSKRGSLLRTYSLNDNVHAKPSMEVFVGSHFNTDMDDRWWSIEVSKITENRGSIDLVLRPDKIYGLKVSTDGTNSQNYEMNLRWTEEAHK